MKEIKTNGITILLIEVPEDAKEFKIENGLLLFKADFIPFGIVILPQGNYQTLGKSTELNGDNIVECKIIFRKIEYRNYRNGKFNLGNPLASYLSLLEANGIVDRNPYGDNCPPDVEPENDDDLGVVSSIRYQKIGQWRVAQSKVKHYLVLKRI